MAIKLTEKRAKRDAAERAERERAAAIEDLHRAPTDLIPPPPSADELAAWKRARNNAAASLEASGPWGPLLAGIVEVWPDMTRGEQEQVIFTALAAYERKLARAAHNVTRADFRRHVPAP